jgi:hypothetical protein
VRCNTKCSDLSADGNGLEFVHVTGRFELRTPKIRLELSAEVCSSKEISALLATSQNEERPVLLCHFASERPADSGQVMSASDTFL